MKVNRFFLPLIIFGALFGSYAVTKAAGQWSVSGKQSIDTTNLISGDEVRGWMTFAQLSDGFGIEIGTLYQILDIPADLPPETALKDMEGILPGFEISNIRIKIDDYLSGDSPVQNDVAEELPVIESTPTPAVENEGGILSPVETPTHPPISGSEVRGKTTLSEISAQYKIPLEQLLNALNLPPDTDDNTALKDMGIEIQVVRDTVSTLQNQVP